MATYTTNYNLEKPDSSDPFGDFRTSYNSNMDIIDQNLGGGGGSSTLAGLSDVDINAPADGESLVYDSNSQKWVNGNVSGGGGGILLNQTLNFVGTTATITDSRVTADSRVFVYYHDTSLDEALACGLDADTSANTITFEANTAPQGTIVCDIVIDGGVGNGFIGIADCYSTEEKEVGCWTDGKPLYQKTVEFGNLPNNTVKSVAHGIADIDKIVLVIGTIIRTLDNDTLTIPFVSATGLNNNIQCSVNPTNCNIRTGSDQTGRTATFTLKYTKTTDTAGSGTWTPSGEPSHHYSTNEQVVGTYIDGKTLYEKTFTATLSNIASGTPTNFADISGIGIDEIADISGRVNYYNGANWFNVNIGGYFNIYAYPTSYLQFVQTMTAQTTDRSYKILVTIRYTKSS